MDGALFRQEVMQARAGSSIGRIVAVPAWPLWVGVAVVVAGALGLILLLAFGSYTRQTRVAGILQPSLGLTRLEAPMAGTLTNLRVREGQRVIPGQVLARIHATREGEQGEAGGIALEALRLRQRSQKLSLVAGRQQLQQRHQGLQQQLHELEAEADIVRAQYESQRHRLALANQTLVRMRQLRQQRYVSEVQVAQHEGDMLDQQTALLTARRQMALIERSAEQVRQSLAEWPSQWAAQEARAEHDAALLATEAADLDARSHALLKAPAAGVVSRIEALPGQPVRAGQVLLVLLPSVSRLEAHLQVPSVAVGHVSVGDRVQLRYHAYPYQDHGHFGGRIERVDGVALASNEAVGRRDFRVVVRLDEQVVRTNGLVHALRAGSTLDANVLGERRALWQWAWHPLRGIVDPSGETLAPESRGTLTGSTDVLAPSQEVDAGSQPAKPVF